MRRLELAFRRPVRVCRKSARLQHLLNGARVASGRYESIVDRPSRLDDRSDDETTSTTDDRSSRTDSTRSSQLLLLLMLQPQLHQLASLSADCRFFFPVGDSIARSPGHSLRLCASKRYLAFVECRDGSGEEVAEEGSSHVVGPCHHDRRSRESGG